MAGYIKTSTAGFSRSQGPRGLRRRSATAPPAGIAGSNPSGDVDVRRCCVLSGRGLCDGLITRPEESYRLWCVVVCDLETSRLGRKRHALGRSDTGENICLDE